MIPIFGWYLKKIGSISIKRNKVSKENLSFFKDISRQINSSEQTFNNFSPGHKVIAQEIEHLLKKVQAGSMKN